MNEIQLNELSFRNRVWFYEKELLELQKTGKQFLSGNLSMKKNWKEIIAPKHIGGRGGGRRVYLNSRVVCLLTNLYLLRDIDMTHSVPVGILSTLDRMEESWLE